MSSPTPPPSSSPRPARAFFPDVAEGLVWPLILRAPRLALRPMRLSVALLFVVLCELCLRLPDIWSERPRSLSSPLALRWDRVCDLFGEAVKSLSPIKVVEAMRVLFIKLPQELWAEQPWYSLLAAGVPIVALWALLGGVVSRSAAEDAMAFERKPWTFYLAFSLKSRFSLPLAILGPLGFVGLLCLLVAAGGFLLRVPAVQIVAAGASLLALLGTLLGVLLLVGFFAGLPMLVPAVMCEGTDAIDANQRTLAYVFGRPMRYAAYLGVFVVLLVLCGRVAELLVDGSLQLAAKLLTAFAGETARPYLHYVMLSGEEHPAAGPTPWSLKAAGGLVAFSAGAWKLLVPAYLFSLFHSGGTMMYLVSRFANDGQEPGELWRGVTVPEVLLKAGNDASKAAADDF
ncbi:MAG: hypothetical protein ACOYN0_03260 [Phycisphaerales bacterium]